MKKFLVVATTLVVGLAVSLSKAEEAKKPKPEGGDKGKGGTPAERADAMIKALDKDKNGTISKAEFEAGPMAAKAKADGKDVGKRFTGMDKNKDGELDKAELSVPPKPPKGGGDKPKPKPKGEGDAAKPEGDAAKPKGEGDAAKPKAEGDKPKA